MAKNPSFVSGFGPFDPNSSCQFFFNLALSDTRYHGQQSSCTISEKTNDPILRKLSDGQRDRGAEKWMD